MEIKTYTSRQIKDMGYNFYADKRPTDTVYIVSHTEDIGTLEKYEPNMTRKQIDNLWSNYIGDGFIFDDTKVEKMDNIVEIHTINWQGKEFNQLVSSILRTSDGKWYNHTGSAYLEYSFSGGRLSEITDVVNMSSDVTIHDLLINDFYYQIFFMGEEYFTNTNRGYFTVQEDLYHRRRWIQLDFLKTTMPYLRSREKWRQDRKE